MVRSITRLITFSLPTTPTPSQATSLAFVAETLASYFLEEGEDDEEIDIEGLLFDAGLRFDDDDDDYGGDDDGDGSNDSFTCLLNQLTAISDPSPGSSYSLVPLGYSECEMCSRNMKLTFHHLIPKQLHSRYIKKRRLPNNLKHDAATMKIEEFLKVYGIHVCRPCHSSIHRCYDNKVLAEEYNTLDRIMEDDKLKAWADFHEGKRIGKSDEL
jgi:hypothetical protein